jgi:hypothetical protein
MANGTQCLDNLVRQRHRTAPVRLGGIGYRNVMLNAAPNSRRWLRSSKINVLPSRGALLALRPEPPRALDALCCCGVTGRMLSSILEGGSAGHRGGWVPGDG